MRYLFFHGGPGLNSFCEEKLLKPLLRDLAAEGLFWNEPSRLRPDGDAFRADDAFLNGLSSAKKFTESAFREQNEKRPLHLIGHSFSAHQVRIIAHELGPEVVGKITLIAPVFDSPAVLKKMMAVAIADFTELDRSLAEKLGRLVPNIGDRLNATMREALETVLQDPQLLDHYWQNDRAKRAYLETLSVPASSLDIESFFAVLKDFLDRFPIIERPLSPQIPVQLIFGAWDPIVDTTYQLAQSKRWMDVGRSLVFEKSGHFPHLEESPFFLSQLTGF